MTLPLSGYGERQGRNGPRRAFTLVEMMVAMGVLMIILTVTVSLVGQVSGVWKNSSAKIDSFQSARLAFELITRTLSQATLNTYLGYDSDTNPHYYLRKSDLRFLCTPAGSGGLPGSPGTGSAVFFEAPLGYTAAADSYGGMEALLNTVGYYVSFTDAPKPSHIRLPTPFRYRLMQLLVPAESNLIYANATNLQWISSFAPSSVAIADNVVALLIRPQDPSATPVDVGTGYLYDTYNSADASPSNTAGTQLPTSQQLPPLLQVTLVAIEEASALRLANGSTPPPKIASALAGKFTDPARYDSDLAALTGAFDTAGIRYQVFSGAVPLAESKWTK